MEYTIDELIEMLTLLLADAFFENADKVELETKAVRELITRLEDLKVLIGEEES